MSREIKNPMVGQECMVYGENNKIMAVWDGFFLFFGTPIKNIKYWKPAFIHYQINPRENGEDKFEVVGISEIDVEYELPV